MNVNTQHSLAVTPVDNSNTAIVKPLVDNEVPPLSNTEISTTTTETQVAINSDHISPTELAFFSLLDTLYSEFDGESENKDFCKSAGLAATYGEITANGCKTICNSVKFTSNDIFYDLGSGIGRFVIQIFLYTACKKAIGVELGPNRYRKSVEAKQKFKEIMKRKPYIL